MTIRTLLGRFPTSDAHAYRFNSCAPAEKPVRTIRLMFGNCDLLPRACIIASIQSKEDV
jgi:hypothetical protein